MMYPPGWPRCPACGDFALDGHITCGRAECDEGGRRNARNVGRANVMMAMDAANKFMMIIGTAKESRKWVRARIVYQLLFVHRDVVPLDFDLLVRAGDLDLCHDIMGIDEHLGPAGWINDGFLPRCAVSEPGQIAR